MDRHDVYFSYHCWSYLYFSYCLFNRLLPTVTEIEKKTEEKYEANRDWIIRI